MPLRIKKAKPMQIAYLATRILIIFLALYFLQQSLTKHLYEVESAFTNTETAAAIFLIVLVVPACIYATMGQKLLYVVQTLSWAVSLIGFGVFMIGLTYENAMAAQPGLGGVMAVFLYLAQRYSFGVMVLVMMMEGFWTLYFWRTKPLETWAAQPGMPLKDYQPLRTAALLIALGDEGINQGLAAMAEDFTRFLTEHQQDYAARQATELSPREKLHLGVVDILIQAGHVKEVDWKEEAGEIAGQVDALIRRHGLPVSLADFTPSAEALADTEVAIAEMGVYLLERGLLLGSIVLDADAYYLFILDPVDGERLVELSRQLAENGLGKGKTLAFTFTFGGQDLLARSAERPSFDSDGVYYRLEKWFGEIEKEGEISQEVGSFYFAWQNPGQLALTGAPGNGEEEGWSVAYRPDAGPCTDLEVAEDVPRELILTGLAHALTSLWRNYPGAPVFARGPVYYGVAGLRYPLENPLLADRLGPDMALVSPSQVQRLLWRFYNLTAIPTIVLSTCQEATGVFDSKLGGRPYLPPGFAYPLENLPDGSTQPLRLLAQLNFAQLPPLPGYPETGILQFYISRQELWGLDFQDMTSARGFRCVYHQEIIADEGLLQEPPPMPALADSDFPVKGEVKLTGRLARQPLSAGDYRFDETMLSLFRREVPTPEGREWEALPARLAAFLGDELGCGGTRVGGYPAFTQVDPRDRESYQDYDCLLFQCDSDYQEGIMWGDSGIASFFITREDLKNRDFSKVMYNWDCY